MEPGLRSVLVLAALCNFASSLHRRHQYHFITEPRNWSEAQQYCREKHSDLVTVGDAQDLEELAARAESGGHPFFFVGLHRGWGWSLSCDDDYKEGEPAYWNWAGGQPNESYCGSMGPTGEWFATNCGSALNFSCYDASAADVSQRFTSENESTTWSGAQAHCRKLYSDLARVRDRLDNEELQRRVARSAGSVWIGLTRTSWTWSDGSYLAFTPWEGFEPLVPGLGGCAVLNVTSKSLGMMKCAETAPFICYSDLMKKQLVRLKLFAHDSSVDMSDPAAEESVLNWVKKELRNNGVSEDVNVSWRKVHYKGKTQDESEQICRFKHIK